MRALTMFVERHAGKQHGGSATGQCRADGIAKRGQYRIVFVAATTSGRSGNLTQDCGGILVLAPSAKPNKRSVDYTLETQVFQVIAVVVHLAHSHTLAAIFLRMKCVGSGNTNVKCGRKGWDNCSGENVSRA